MWYHYLLLLAGAYLLATAIYTIVTGPKSVISLSMNGVQAAIGAGITYYGWSGIWTPPATSILPGVPTPTAMMGGLRRMMGGRR